MIKNKINYQSTREFGKAMKFLVLIALVAITAARPDDNHYDHKYDNFDIDELVSNERLLENYALCFKGEGKCTAEGADIKKWIPEGSRSGCAKCTPKQKVLVAKFIRQIQKKFPQHWEVLSKQGDPEGKYKDELEKFLKENAPA